MQKMSNKRTLRSPLGPEGKDESATDQQQEEMRQDQEGGQLDHEVAPEKIVVTTIPERKRRKVPTIAEVREMVKLMDFETRGQVTVYITSDLASDIDAEVAKEEALLNLQQEKAAKLRALRGGQA